ncbi:MAG: hypothetical protein K2O40_14375 [Lachnospiraceae bacterium]|nr:hypothetical protein [Lachnospiraceae bacterium]
MRKTETMQKKQLGGVFPNKEVFEKIYSECVENQPQASEAVRCNYKEMIEAFEEYLNATQEDMFRYAYQCGYEAAITAFTKGGAA